MKIDQVMARMALVALAMDAWHSRPSCAARQCLARSKRLHALPGARGNISAPVHLRLRRGGAR